MQFAELALGLLHGPAELLPISSSGHVSALAPRRDKELEVALHLGSAAALPLVLGSRLRGARPAFVVPAIAPPALAGLALEDVVERRLGTPGTVAAGLLAGAVAMLTADRARGRRTAADAGVTDGLAVGLAQATALVPGVSRSAAALAAARLRGFGRADAAALSWQAGLPVLLGAAALKGTRLVRRPPERERARALATGAAAAALATFAARPLAGAGERALWPWALYRIAAAAAIAVHGRPPHRLRP